MPPCGVFEIHFVRRGAAALAGFEAIDRFEFGFSQGEVENVDVVGDSFGPD